jgi:hypothetical protein
MQGSAAAMTEASTLGALQELRLPTKAQLHYA